MSMEQIQEKYMEFQMVDAQVNQIKEQLKALDAQATELKNLSENLDELEKVSEDSESLIPVNSGVYLKGKITDKKKVIINVGSNIMVEKDIESAKHMVESQINQISDVRVQFVDEYKTTVKRAKALQKEIIALQSKQGAREGSQEGLQE